MTVVSLGLTSARSAQDGRVECGVCDMYCYDVGLNDHDIDLRWDGGGRVLIQHGLAIVPDILWRATLQNVPNA